MCAIRHNNFQVRKDLKEIQICLRLQKSLSDKTQIQINLEKIQVLELNIHLSTVWAQMIKQMMQKQRKEREI